MLRCQALLRLGAALLCLLALAGPARAGGRAARFLAQTAPSAEVGSCSVVLVQCWRGGVAAQLELLLQLSQTFCRARLHPPPPPQPSQPIVWLTASMTASNLC